MQIDIPGCVIPNEAGTFRKNYVDKHLSGWVKIAQ